MWEHYKVVDIHVLVDILGDAPCSLHGAPEWDKCIHFYFDGILDSGSRSWKIDFRYNVDRGNRQCNLVEGVGIEAWSNFFALFFRLIDIPNRYYEVLLAPLSKRQFGLRCKTANNEITSSHLFKFTE